MALDRINTGRYSSDKNQAQTSARAQLKIIMANKEKLLRVKNGKKFLTVAVSFDGCKEDFTPKQLSYIDTIYEKVMEGAGFESFKATYKPNKKTLLRYGNGK